MDKFAPLAAIASPVIALIMQVLKKTLWPKKKFVPIANLLIGIVICYVVAKWRAFELNTYQVVVVGLMVGGTATGLYEATKGLTTTNNNDIQ